MARTRKSAQVPQPPEFVPAPVVGARALNLLRRVLTVVHADDLRAVQLDIATFLDEVGDGPDTP